MRATARYKALVESVKRALDDADPIGLLKGGAPADEYSLEVGTIVPLLINATDAMHARRIIHDEFVQWFGAETVGPESAYEAASLRSWEAILLYRQARD